MRNLNSPRFLTELVLSERFLVAPLLEMTKSEGVEMTQRAYNFEIPKYYITIRTFSADGQAAAPAQC